MTAIQKPTQLPKPPTRPVGGTQKSIADSKVAKTDLALRQLHALQNQLDDIVHQFAGIEEGYKAVDLSEFPSGVRRRLEREIQWAVDSLWLDAKIQRRVIHYAANGLRQDSMPPRDLPPRQPKTPAADSSIDDFGLQPMELPKEIWEQ